MIDNKIDIIRKDCNISEDEIARILYSYLTICLQELLLNKQVNTIFGQLTLDSNNKLQLTNDKFGLISLFNKKDIKIIRKICENGPDYNIFE